MAVGVLTTGVGAPVVCVGLLVIVAVGDEPGVLVMVGVGVVVVISEQKRLVLILIT